MTKCWTVASAPLYTQPSWFMAIRVPFRTVVELTGQDLTHNNAFYVEVVYGKFTGFIYIGYLEEYIERYKPEVVIDTPTPETYDAAQYIIWYRQRKYNMCGQLCVSFIAQLPLSPVLELSQEALPALYNRVWKGTNDRGTSLKDLSDMLGLYGFTTTLLTTELTDKVIGRALLTPHRISELLTNHQIIIGVSISNAAKGRLQPRTVKYPIAHWVVVTYCEYYGADDGTVEVYNPYNNCRELYMWRDFMAAVGSVAGICIQGAQYES